MSGTGETPDLTDLTLGEDKRIRHNHLTRDIKPRGECPGCDAYCRSGQIEPSANGGNGDDPS